MMGNHIYLIEAEKTAMRRLYMAMPYLLRMEKSFMKRRNDPNTLYYLKHGIEND